MLKLKMLTGLAAGMLIIPSIATAKAPNDSDTVLVRVPKTMVDACRKNPQASELCEVILTKYQPTKGAPIPTKAMPGSPGDGGPRPKRSGPNLIPPLFPTAVTSEWCRPSPKGLFVRADPLDNFNYLIDLGPADAKGATVSYTNDRLAGTQTATINGRVSYMLYGEQCSAPDFRSLDPFVSAVGFAPFISSDGTWNQPTTKKVSNSSLKTGADFQLGLDTGSFFITKHYLYASPYYQTDYQQLARIDGVVLAYEPIIPSLYIDYGPVTPYYSFFWQLRAEADFVEVSNPGLTNLVKGNHEWLGETARANLALFPLNRIIDWPEWVGGRFSLIGTVKNFYDAQNRTKADYYSVVLQYKLGECKKDDKSGDATAPCSIQGSSAISFEYDYGTNRDTLVKANQYMIKLGYAY